MTSVAEGLFKSLPKPKYIGEDEEVPQHAQPRGPRIVGADQIDQSQIVLRVGRSVSTLQEFFSFYFCADYLGLRCIENRPSTIWQPCRMATSSS